jgi:hypothetical protein
MHTVDATTRERLIRLRLILDEAEMRIQERTQIGRHLAVVLLDGACEYAMGLAIAELGLQPKTDRFNDRYKALISSVIGSTWAAGSWKGVSEQRGARNRAQHDGTSVDADDLVRWSADTETFVRSLCQAVYKVELRAVTLTEAILTPSIRTALADAEAALAGGDAARGFESAMVGFDEARINWRAQRADAYGLAWSETATIASALSANWHYRTPGEDPMQELFEIQPFASDLGEYVWLLARRADFERAEPAPITVDVAGRAFRFAYFWVLRWEAFTRRYEWRRIDGAEPYEPPLSGREHAKPSLWDVVDVSGIRPYADQEPVFTIGLQIADIPEAEREHWAGFVRQALNDAAPRDDAGLPSFYASVADDGRISLGQMRCDLEPDKLIALVVGAIAKAQPEFERYNASRGTWTDQYDEFLEPYSELVRQVAFSPGQSLLGTLTGHGLPDDFIVSAELAIPMDEWTQHDVLVSLSRLFPAANDRPVNYDHGTLSFRSSLSPMQVRELAQEIAKDLLTARSDRTDKEAQLESMRAQIQDGLSHAIATRRDPEP